MFRLLPILFISAILIACSSDDSSSLIEWLGDQGIAASYGKGYFEAELSINSIEAGFDSSAFMVSSFAALGNASALEHTLYFGLVAHDSIKTTWNLRTDSLFYRDKFPLESREISAKLYWLAERDSLEPDSSWLKFEKTWEDSADISFTWQVRNALDSFTINLPQELLESYRGNMLLGLRLVSNDVVLRIAPPRLSDIDGLVRVGQKSKELEACTCLYAGVMDSINISFGINENVLPNETVVFAQIFIPKTDSEFEKHNIPLYAYNEAYRMDTALVYDSLKFQATTKLRRYASSDSSLNFTLRFGNPMLPEKVFAPRPDYAKYDFANAVGKNAKLKIWYAKTDLN
jgi:hypothetical protein